MRLGVFGGTFNPVHIGHLRAAEEVREAIGLDRVLFVPAGVPPLKGGGALPHGGVHARAYNPADSFLAPAWARLRMVELAVAGNPAFAVSDVEAARARTSYTVDTLAELARLHPEAELFFILGLDAFLDLPAWKSPDALVRNVDFVVMVRPGADLYALDRSPYVRELTEIGDTVARMALVSGRTASLVRVTQLHVSATAIRRMLAEGKGARYLLPEAVESFIMSQGLYAGI